MNALIEAARAALAMLEMADCSTGYCCCGSAVDGHGIYDGHGPVDDGDYHQMKAIEALRTALAAAEQPAEPVALTPAAMKRGGFYNWKNQPDRLIYLRRFDGWHQFKKIGDPREVWCEVLDGDLHMLEETAASPAASDQASLPEIDYEALIEAAFKRCKAPQGTARCVAFKAGAEWFREQVIGGQP